MDNEEFRDKCSSLVAPHIEPIIKILDRLFTRYGLKIPLEFWISIIFFIFSLIIYFTEISYFPIFFGSLAVIVFFYANFDIVRNKVRLNKIPATTQFLADLENKTIRDVEKFLRDYRNLSTDELIKIANSDFFNYPSIQLSIVKFQRISGDFLIFLVSKGLDKKIGVILLRQYVYRTTDDISNILFNKLITDYPDKKFIKSLFANFPLHLKTQSWFYRVATFRVKIRDWFNYGSGDGLIGVIAFILGIFGFSNYYKTQLSSQILYQTNFGNTFYWISLIMSFLTVSMILFIILKLFILILLRGYKFLLYLVAPSNPNF